MPRKNSNAGHRDGAGGSVPKRQHRWVADTPTSGDYQHWDRWLLNNAKLARQGL
jgi:hypothetical protein